MQNTFLMCCPCHFGLEHTLHFELKKLGAEQIQVQDGRILFRGDSLLLAKSQPLPVHSGTGSDSTRQFSGIYI